MKMTTGRLPFLGLTALILLSACRKDLENPRYILGQLRTAPANDSINQPPIVLISDSQSMAPPVAPGAPMPQQSAPAGSCPLLPIYGSAMVFPQPASGADNILNPVNNPGAGHYLSWPVGMVIDSVSGAIDLTASESGTMYVIGFVPAGTHDTCLSTLTIGGASYADSIYILTNNKKVADPYYNASLNAANPCQNGNACNFDITGSAAGQHLYMNAHSGELDLEKTLDGIGNKGGVFGTSPVNGQTVTADFYYQISDDPSNNAVQHMAIQFVYYDSPSLIDAGVLNIINKRLANLLSGTEISTSFNPKPPLIVIVRHN